MTIIVVYEQCAPNRHPIRIVECRADITSDPVYVVEETDPDGEWEYTDGGMGNELTLEEAKRQYAERVKELRDTPNWEAQEEYDDDHGTINGYSPWQYQREE